MFKALWLLTKRSSQKYSADNCSQLAAAISYYVLFSIAPIAIVGASIFGLIARNDDFRDDVVERVVDATPLSDDEGPGFVTDTIEGVSRVSAALSIVGLVGLAWSASAVAGAVRRALNIVWHAPSGRPFAQQKLVDFAMLLTLGVLLLASIAGTAALETLRRLSADLPVGLSGDRLIWIVPSLLVPAAATFLTFLLIYRFVPSVHRTTAEIWPAALFATVLFELMKNGFTIYVTHFNNYDVVYGSLGAVMLFLLWTYLASSILLLGAVLAFEYASLRRGEYAEALAQPGGRPMDAIRRAARGLFVSNRD